MSYLKPTGITGLDVTHPLNGNIKEFWEIGQLDKDLVSDTAITTTAVADADADIGDCRIFDADADAYSETITVNGEHTALIVGKITTTFGTSQNIQFINYHVAGHRFYTGYQGARRYEFAYRGNYGANNLMQTPPAADQSEIDAYRAFAATYAATGCKSCSNGGTVTSYGLTTSAWIAGDVEAAVLNSFVNGATCKIGAIVIFDKVLSDAELQSVTSDPWAMVSGAAVFGVASVSDSTPQPGDSVVITLENGTAPYSNLRIAGQAATIASQDSTTVTITWPDLRTFGNKSLNFNVIHEVLVDDTDGDTANTNITTLPPTGVEIVEVLNPNVTTDSFVYDDSSTMATGDYYSGEWTTGGNSQPFPVDGDTDQLDLTVGTHVAEIYLYQDYGSGFREWAGPATITLTGSTPGLELDSAAISADGTQLLLIFNESVTFGAGGNGGLALTLTNGVDVNAYVSGDGTNTLIYSLDGIVLSNESGTVAYTQPGDGIEASSDNEDIASFSGVTLLNNSTVAPVAPTITTQPQSQTVVNGVTATFQVIANTGGLADPITYQWRADGVNISGATSSTYQVTANIATNNGVEFDCVLTSSQSESVTSSAALLTVTAANTRITTGELVDRSVFPNVVQANTQFNYRVRNNSGAITATGTFTADLSGFATIDSSLFGTVGESVFIEILHNDNTYSGFPVTLTETP